ncbi:hypothetical protein ABZY05_41835 [Streptomyces canus]|uniref:hypothetical protein n=1 Tax=Streptomyces canus TaxID=58343 RepID=UPI00339F8A72
MTPAPSRTEQLDAKFRETLDAIRDGPVKGQRRHLPRPEQGNANAIRLYESIGFTLRRRTAFSLVRQSEAAVLEEMA